MAEERIKVGDGKYELIFNNGSFKALRHGKEWRDLLGDGMVLALFQRIQELEVKCATMTDLINGLALKPIKECANYETCYKEALEAGRPLKCITCHNWELGEQK